MHTFHIPVMGLSFTIDTPLKVARYGISSVVSISNDKLVEDMRAHHSAANNIPFQPISNKENDYRARRITAYLNLLDLLVSEQMKEVRNAPIDMECELTKYISLLPDSAPIKMKYVQYLEADAAQKKILEQQIRDGLKAGSIDVNIMTKLNKPNFDRHGNILPPEYAEALAAFRGFANSTLNSSVVFSAGFNPRLYSYIEHFPEFFPNETGQIRKHIILKVSDYRSALIQGKFLAKKGIWVSEFRIESGLNCGGHAFPTEGLLLGPILEEFKSNRELLREELFSLCKDVWKQRVGTLDLEAPAIRLSVQGGIGTAHEQQFLTDYYGVDTTGWGTPFLLVPEATTVDTETLSRLMLADAGDLYLSKSSPLGVPFNNLRDSASELKREARINSGKPGSPCLKKHLVSNTEFTRELVCTASRKYQYFKIKELKNQGLREQDFQEALENIVVKSCLCEDLSATAYVTYGMKAQINPAPAVCPGPNLAYFSGKYSLREMVDHIYGRISLLNETYRPHMFLNELKMYIDYLQNELEEHIRNFTEKKAQYLNGFRENIEQGIRYYEALAAQIDLATFGTDLKALSNKVSAIELVSS